MQRYSIFALARNALTSHRNWRAVWHASSVRQGPPPPTLKWIARVVDDLRTGNARRRLRSARVPPTRNRSGSEEPRRVSGRRRGEDDSRRRRQVDSRRRDPKRRSRRSRLYASIRIRVFSPTAATIQMSPSLVSGRRTRPLVSRTIRARRRRASRRYPRATRRRAAAPSSRSQSPRTSSPSTATPAVALLRLRLRPRRGSSRR